MSDYSVTLSTTEPNNYVGLIKLRQGDVASQSIQATITANGQLFNFDRLTVFFNAVLPNGNVVRDKVTNVDYANSKLNYVVAGSFLQEVSQVTAWFSFESGDKIIDSTKNFQYSVIAGWKECIPQGNYIYELSEIQREIEEIISNKDFTSLIYKISSLDTDIKYLDERLENSNAELIASRNGKSNLKTRIDDLENETTAQLAEKANKDEVANGLTAKGAVLHANLPTTGNTVGDYYYCSDGDGVQPAGNYVWNGTTWYFGGTGDQGYSVLKKDLVDIVDGLQMYHINDFNKKDVTLDRYLGRSVGETSMYDSPIPSSPGFVCNKIYKITKGDVIYTNNGSVIPFLYDSNGLFLERLTDESIKNKPVENEQARYMKWQYGSKNQLDTIMINVGHPLPDDYVGYDAVSITSEETKEMEERVNILENQEVANKSKCYVLLSFDDQTQMYADRFPIMKEYGFPFTFCLNSGFQDNNGFANDSEKQTFFEMVSHGCDVAQYHIGRNISGIGENSTVEEWQNAVSNLLDFINDYGIYPVTYFARQNVLYDNAIKALKNLGFEISRSGMYSPENDYRWVESFDDSRFNTPCYLINATNLEKCKEYLDACVQNGWSIAFMTHRLTGTDDNNCDESTFRTLMDYIKNYTNQGKCEVVTYQSFLNNKTKKGKEIENLRNVKRLNWIQSKIN